MQIWPFPTILNNQNQTAISIKVLFSHLLLRNAKFWTFKKQSFKKVYYPFSFMFSLANNLWEKLDACFNCYYLERFTDLLVVQQLQLLHDLSCSEIAIFPFFLQKFLHLPTVLETNKWTGPDVQLPSLLSAWLKKFYVSTWVLHAILWAQRWHN